MSNLASRPARSKPPTRRDARQSWPDWTDQRWTIVPEPEDEPRPTAAHGHEPDAWAAAFWTGFNLGLEREDASPLKEWSGYLARAFTAGHVAGHRVWEARLDAMYADRAGDGHPTDADVWPNGVC
jgi:hypothetical protein